MPDFQLSSVLWLGYVCRMYVVGNGSLIVTSSLENDSAVYQCFAVNDVGETSATVLLTVFSMISL